jgi:sec-independent protein translocase protein TatB
MFDLSLTKLLVLAVIGLVIFGPDQLPKMAGQLARALGDLRRIADKAKADLHTGLGPEFADFDLADLHPRTFVRKHLLDELDGHLRDDPSDNGLHAQAQRPHQLAQGERPPFDSDAT